MNIIRIRSGAGFLLLLLLAAGCAARRPVSEIQADPARYAEKPVTIAGTVTRSYGVWKWGTYELEDASGRIWVISRRANPARGSRIEVRGRSVSAFNLPFLNFTGTVFQEENRKVDKR